MFRPNLWCTQFGAGYSQIDGFGFGALSGFGRSAICGAELWSPARLLGTQQGGRDCPEIEQGGGGVINPARLFGSRQGGETDSGSSRAAMISSSWVVSSGLGTEDVTVSGS